MADETFYQTINKRYSTIARGAQGGNYGKTVAELFDYSSEDLQSIPQEANLGLSCGNPIALANLKEEEWVVDLGCGVGLDVFLAAKKVGEARKVDMLSKAQANATNVSFVSSRITSIPLSSSSMDVTISNCVINLVSHSEKHRVLKEAHRILKPRGRFAVSYILVKKDLTDDMKKSVALYVGCVTGPSNKEDYELWLKEPGFSQLAIVDSGADLNIYTKAKECEGLGSGCCGPQSEPAISSGCQPQKEADGGVVADMKMNLKYVDLNEWAGSFQVFAEILTLADSGTNILIQFCSYQ